MVDGVDPIGSEGVLAACFDEVECTEDDSVDDRMDKVCNSSSEVVLLDLLHGIVYPHDVRPVLYRNLPPRPRMSAVEYINMLVQVYEINK